MSVTGYFHRNFKRHKCKANYKINLFLGPARFLFGLRFLLYLLLKNSFFNVFRFFEEISVQNVPCEVLLDSLSSGFTWHTDGGAVAAAIFLFQNVPCEVLLDSLSSGFTWHTDCGAVAAAIFLFQNVPCEVLLDSLSSGFTWHTDCGAVAAAIFLPFSKRAFLVKTARQYSLLLYCVVVFYFLV